MKNRIPVLLAFLLSGASLCGAATPPMHHLAPPGREALTCLVADRTGCGILIKRGVNEEGYYLTIETGAHGVDSVKVGLRGRSILIGRAESRRTERMSDRGAFGVVSRSSRFASRLHLPPDADMRRVRRVETDSVITITVPRLQAPRSGGYPFGYYP